MVSTSFPSVLSSRIHLYSSSKPLKGSLVLNSFIKAFIRQACKASASSSRNCHWNPCFVSQPFCMAIHQQVSFPSVPITRKRFNFFCTHLEKLVTLLLQCAAGLPYFNAAILHVPLCSGSRRKQQRASRQGLASGSFNKVSHSVVEIPISPQL